jgi:enoyl-CoA hydratase/carnithine racemase
VVYRSAVPDYEYETLLVEVTENVAVVTLNRPDVLNAFNLAMQRELRDLWHRLRLDEEVHAVVLTGAGEKAFCTGIDRQESIEMYLEDPTAVQGTGRVTTPFMYDDPGDNINPKANDLWKPVIAAVNGMACGGALYMLGEADIIIAAEHATFFDPHVTYGMVAGFESVHLMQKLPLGETLRMQLLGSRERLSAQRAHQVGLVSEIVPKEELLDRAMLLATDIAEAPVMAIQGTLKAIWMAYEVSRQQALRQVSTWVSLGTEYDNIESGQAAFQNPKNREWRLR